MRKRAAWMRSGWPASAPFTASCRCRRPTQRAAGKKASTRTARRRSEALAGHLAGQLAGLLVLLYTALWALLHEACRSRPEVAQRQQLLCSFSRGSCCVATCRILLQLLKLACSGVRGQDSSSRAAVACTWGLCLCCCGPRLGLQQLQQE